LLSLSGESRGTFLRQMDGLKPVSFNPSFPPDESLVFAAWQAPAHCSYWRPSHFPLKTPRFT
jgi:hypothetical protein